MPSPTRRCCVAGALIAAPALIATAPPAEAVLIDFTFQGGITANTDPDTLLPAGFGVGESFTLVIRVDTDTPSGPFPGDYPTADGSFYPGAIIDYALMNGATTIDPGVLPASPYSSLQVQNDLFDSDGIAASIGDLADAHILAAVIGDTTPFSSEDIPTSLDLADFDLGLFRYAITGTGDYLAPQAEALGAIESITSREVPGPAGSLILLPALGILARRRMTPPSAPAQSISLVPVDDGAIR
jgi:hypothetical protein